MVRERCGRELLHLVGRRATGTPGSTALTSSGLVRVVIPAKRRDDGFGSRTGTAGAGRSMLAAGGGLAASATGGRGRRGRGSGRHWREIRPARRDRRGLLHGRRHRRRRRRLGWWRRTGRRRARVEDPVACQSAPSASSGCPLPARRFARASLVLGQAIGLGSPYRPASHQPGRAPDAPSRAPRQSPPMRVAGRGPVRRRPPPRAGAAARPSGRRRARRRQMSSAPVAVSGREGAAGLHPLVRQAAGGQIVTVGAWIPESRNPVGPQHAQSTIHERDQSGAKPGLSVRGGDGATRLFDRALLLPVPTRSGTTTDERMCTPVSGSMSAPNAAPVPSRSSSRSSKRSSGSCAIARADEWRRDAGRPPAAASRRRGAGPTAIRVIISCVLPAYTGA